MFETALPIIRVSSSATAEEFYCKRLGFTVLSSWRANATLDDPRYLTLVRDGARLHLHSFPSGTVGAAAVYVFVDDIDGLYAELSSRGIRIRTSLRSDSDMRCPPDRHRRGRGHPPQSLKTSSHAFHHRFISA
jgi:glyoxalase superfamily protein